ncbi:MAG: hypothetical protein ACI4IN_02995 [Eubacterium sp.]
MSSTNKTDNLGLNQWVGTDRPKMQDFNQDNLLIDSAVTRHITDSEAHVTGADKTVWNKPYHIQVYTGDGSSTRSISIDAGFTPRWGIVFAASYPPGLTDFTNKAHYNYFGFVSTDGGNPGLTLNGTTLKVTQSSTPVNVSEYRSYNTNGVGYVIILFR